MTTNSEAVYGIAVRAQHKRRNIFTATGITILAVLFSISSQAYFLHDSIPEKPYRKIKILDNQVEIVVPVKFRKMKQRKIGQPYPYTATQRSGYHNKNGTALKFYYTDERFPADDPGIKVWDELEQLSSKIEKKIFLESGYVVVDRQKIQARISKDLYFVKFLHPHPVSGVEYILLMCVELKGKMLIGFINAPRKEFIDTWEKEFYESLKFNE